VTNTTSLLDRPPDAAVAIFKSTPESRYTLGLAYPADRLDAHGEYMTAVELERSAWAYVQKYRDIGVVHLDGTEGAGTVVESYIYRGPDWEITAPDGTETTIHAGDWLMGVIWQPEVWELIKSGELDGLSMQGYAIRRPVPHQGGPAERPR